MQTENLIRTLFLEPVSKGADRLCILSANASPGMASWLLKTYDECKISNIKLELIVGSTVINGINMLIHEGFKELHGTSYSGNSCSFSCSYVYQLPAVQTNLYIWLKNDIPFCAFSDIGEFTQQALLRNCCMQVSEAVPKDAYSIFEEASSRSVYCSYSEIEEDIRIYQSNLNIVAENGTHFSENTIHLSLLTGKGIETGKRSGLNWGQRNKRNKNEAYIPLPSHIAKSGFFPLNKQHFIVVTDDKHTLLLRVEQQNDKAITTPASNALLGEYFRNRLGMPNGAFISKDDLVRYGRTDVTFCKIDDEQFYMDFSVNKES